MLTEQLSDTMSDPVLAVSSSWSAETPKLENAQVVTSEEDNDQDMDDNEAQLDYCYYYSCNYYYN